MAFASRKHNDEFDPIPMAEMNVTPLVDVMLVLLIIFMVTAPLMATGVPVDLPKAQMKPLNEQKPPLVVSIDANGKFFVDKAEVVAEELIYVLGQNAGNKERRIHVWADRTVAYGKVMEIMSLINTAGYTKVALVSAAPIAQKPAAIDVRPAASAAP